jgi:hypothetical protein
MFAIHSLPLLRMSGSTARSSSTAENKFTSIDARAASFIPSTEPNHPRPALFTQDVNRPEGLVRHPHGRWICRGSVTSTRVTSTLVPVRRCPLLECLWTSHRWHDVVAALPGRFGIGDPESTGSAHP